MSLVIIQRLPIKTSSKSSSLPSSDGNAPLKPLPPVQKTRERRTRYYDENELQKHNKETMMTTHQHQTLLDPTAYRAKWESSRPFRCWLCVSETGNEEKVA